MKDTATPATSASNIEETPYTIGYFVDKTMVSLFLELMIQIKVEALMNLRNL